jgi:hypothetical protein
MNLDVTADDSCLDPHVSCVKTSHPATQLDVNPEQRSVRQSVMSGPHHGDSAHTHTTFGTSGKFIRASSSTGATHNEIVVGRCRAHVDELSYVERELSGITVVPVPRRLCPNLRRPTASVS